MTARRHARLDLRLVPVAVAAWLGAFCGISGSAPGLVVTVGAAITAAVIAGLRRSLAVLAVAVVLLAAAGAGFGHHRAATVGPAAELATAEAVVNGELVVTGEPVRSATVANRPPYATLRARWVIVGGRGELWRVRAPILVGITGDDLTRWSAWPVGSRVAVAGRLAPPTPGSDVTGVLRVYPGARQIAGPGPVLRIVDAVRSGLRQAVADRRPDARALVPALVLGDTSAMTPELVAAFQVTGLTHLTAVSGANLTLLLAFVLVAARTVGVRGWALRLLAVSSVFGYVVLCRAEPSVLRAAAMGLVALAALGLGSGRSGPRRLSLAVLALVLIDPFLARSYGFGLSVLATAGILAWSGRWRTRLAGWLPGPIADAIAVPLAAQLATAPVVAHLSGSVSVVGLVANALCGPFVGAATVAGLAAAALSVTSPPLALAAGFVAAWAAQPIIWIAYLTARLPGAQYAWPSSPASLIVLTAGCVLSGLLLGRVLGRRWLVLALALALLVGLLRAPGRPGWPPAGWLLVACSVGQGDALLVSAGRGRAIVVDTGPDPPPVRRCLDQLGVRVVPLLVITHFHADHVGGLAGVLDRRVERIWRGPLTSPPAVAAAVETTALSRGIPVETPPRGTRARLGELGITVLGPVRLDPLSSDEETADEASAAENDASLVLMLETQGVRLLLTGDVEPPGERAILASGADLRADVLKLPHHGSARQEAAFLAATGAALAIASAGLHNEYGHPAPRTLALAQALGMTVLRTDLQGSVAIARVGDRLAAVVEKPGP